MAPLLVTDLFAELSNGRDRISASELALLLGSADRLQEDPHSAANHEELAASLIAQFHHHHHHQQQQQQQQQQVEEEEEEEVHLSSPHAAATQSSDSLDFAEFLQFLLDPRLNPAISVSEKPTQDMTRPLSDYFINTSHNSYLSGNQLSSKSGTSVIISALISGCRVIELDCWPGHNGTIVVHHGHTLTTKASFEECLIAIKENAFTTSDYPVIITIEDHLDADLQTQAAIKIRDVFGDMLFVPSSDEKPPLRFASPEELKHKIIISDTPPKDAIHTQAAADPNTVVETFPYFIPSDLKPEEDSPPTSHTNAKLTIASHIVSATHTVLETIPSSSSAPSRVQDLEDLIYIFSQKINEMKLSSDGQLISGDRSIMANLSEPQVQEMAKLQANSMIKFSHKNLGRMYPFGLRFDSSNPDPFLAWANGFQLAALNFQGQDRNLWIGQALFDQNGKCGYVKKPPHLLPENDFDVNNSMEPKLQLKMRVLMGCNWQVKDGLSSKPDLYVKVALDGIPSDRSKKSTGVVHNSNDPSWENEEFVFPIRAPEMAILRLEVWEKDLDRDDFVGQACIPVGEVKAGLRAVALKSQKGEPLPSTLLCSIAKQS